MTQVNKLTPVARSIYRAEESFRRAHGQRKSPFEVADSGRAAKILRGQVRRQGSFIRKAW